MRGRVYLEEEIASLAAKETPKASAYLPIREF